MSHQDAVKSNKEIVSEVMAAVFVNRNPLSVLHLFSDNYIQHNPLIPNGKDAIPGLVAGLPQDFRYEAGYIVADGDIVMMHGRYTGWGTQPLIVVDIFRIEDGRLAEHWDVMQEEVPASQSANGNNMFPQ